MTRTTVHVSFVMHFGTEFGMIGTLDHGYGPLWDNLPNDCWILLYGH